jgi:monofunctional biosynthetic peptidoglycan transglycosylase
LLGILALVGGYYTLCGLLLVAYVFVDPPTTGVQLERRIESWLGGRDYVKRYEPRSLAGISDHLEHWRGGSTITQQLVKNLFMTTHSAWLRKALELPLAYMAEAVLSKERILELYLNVIEWGDGVFGAEAAALHHYGTSAAALDRERAAGLAACIPDPLRRTPPHMQRYRAIILERMEQTGSRPGAPP